MKFHKLFTPLIAFSTILLMATGCDIANSDSDGPKSVAVTMQLQTNTAAKFKAVNLDSLTEVKLLVEELELESVSDDSADFEVENLIVNLPLDGSSIELTSQIIPSGVYNEFEMEIENEDDESSVSDPDFNENGNNYSIVIRGSYNGEEFLFRSDQDFEIEMELNPALEISDNTVSTAVSINIDPSGWFVGSQGNPLDPSDPANKELIENNIENSFEAEENDDEDEDDDDDDDSEDDD